MGLLDANALAQLLAAGERNHNVIANNLANLDTPGYRTARVRFARELASLLDEDQNLRPGARIQVETYHPMYRALSKTGNDVQLERETVELTKNTLRMKIYFQAVGARISKLRLAIGGR